MRNALFASVSVDDHAGAFAGFAGPAVVAVDAGGVCSAGAACDSGHARIRRERCQRTGGERLVHRPRDDAQPFRMNQSSSLPERRAPR
jgi:hypothetical protein